MPVTVDHAIDEIPVPVFRLLESPVSMILTFERGSELLESRAVAPGYGSEPRAAERSILETPVGVHAASLATPSLRLAVNALASPAGLLVG